MPSLSPSDCLAPVPVAEVRAVLRDGGAVVVDLRSPGEFADDHLPGAVNVPLFDDYERAVVGTLYKQASPERAFDEGRELVTGKIDGLVERICAAAGVRVPDGDLGARVQLMTSSGIEGLERSLEPRLIGGLPERSLVLHCWRGGLRSRSVVALLRGSGLEACVGLEGGYKAYRRQVLEELDAFAGPESFTLRGLTGVGKTLVLGEIERMRPGWTIDLEAIARHRSSLLGMVGREPVSQKQFDSRLASRLRAGLDGRVVYEGESRKVGDAIIPVKVWENLKAGANVLLEAPLDVRVRVLTDDYLAKEANRGPLRTQLQRIESIAKGSLPLVELFDAGREEELVAVLLEHYYDPLYKHSEGDRTHALRVDSSDPASCAREIVEWIEICESDRAAGA